MIKITELSEGQEKSTLFSEESLLIGDTKGDHKAALPFPGKGLKNEHVRIFKQEGALFVQNLANDPFVTLNGHPFFKKQAHSGDILKIRDIELRIEEIAFRHEALSPDPLEVVPKKTTPAPQPSPPPVAAHEAEEVIHAPPPKPKKEVKPKTSLKDFEGENNGSFEETTRKNWPSHLNVSPFRHIRLFSFLLMGFSLVISVIGVETYLRAAEKSHEEELVAAESLSDIAMALTYAQFYHISPQKHNWSDPEFIQNNLLATLSTGSSSGVKLNAQGGFNNCGYILRIYTSSNLTRFLVVAHPTPSLLQWLIPKSAILVDSSTMELRRVRDLKTLNRMLASLNTFDGVNVSLISDLVKQGEIIPLAQLARRAKLPEFQPPRALAFLRPGAENLIYNAPRYYPFGEALLKKTTHFSKSNTSSHELSMLKSELEVLKQLPNLVLYTNEPLASATEAMAALKMIAPEIKYMLASIKYDSEGRLRSTKIVMDSEKSEIFSPPSPTTHSLVNLPLTPSVSKSGVIPVLVTHADGLPLGAIPTSEIAELAEQETTPSNPLLDRLQSLADHREKKLESLYEKIAKSAVAFLKNPHKARFQKKIDHYLKMKKKIETQTKEELFDLAFDFNETDPEILRTTIEQVGLTALWKEALDEKE